LLVRQADKEEKIEPALQSENPLVKFSCMSSVGFTSEFNNELEKLREAYRSLNDLMKNLNNAEICLKNLDLKLTGDHLKVAKWNVEQVKKAITAVGLNKRKSQP
jgi:hypothetical protein